MTYPRVRLTVAAALFAGWLSYLLWLVLLTRHTIVLSRPQFLVADLWVLAQVSEAEGKPARQATIRKLFWFKNPADRKLKDQKITIANLPEAGPQGYTGPGEYILPLTKQEIAGVALYTVTAIPASPGYDWRTAAFVNVMLSYAGDEPKRVAQLRTNTWDWTWNRPGRALPPLAKGATGRWRAVPRERALEFAQAVAEIDGKDAPHVQLKAYDIRIYPWTAETERQIDELVAAR